MASRLLQKKIAACVNLIPSLESHYLWKGKREKAAEVLLVIKTQSVFYPRLEKAVKSLHPYSVPEIVALPIIKGSRNYLRWIQAETS